MTDTGRLHKGYNHRDNQTLHLITLCSNSLCNYTTAVHFTSTGLGQRTRQAVNVRIMQHQGAFA